MRNKTWYTVKEASEILELNRITIRNKIKDKSFKAVKVGREWRISQAEINSILGVEEEVETQESIKKDRYIKKLEDEVKSLRLQINLFKNAASSLVRTVNQFK